MAGGDDRAGPLGQAMNLLIFVAVWSLVVAAISPLITRAVAGWRGTLSPSSQADSDPCDEVARPGLPRQVTPGRASHTP